MCCHAVGLHHGSSLYIAPVRLCFGFTAAEAAAAEAAKIAAEAATAEAAKIAAKARRAPRLVGKRIALYC